MENGEFKAEHVRNWRKFIERANEHQEFTGHKRCFKDAKEITASEAKQDDSLLSVWTRGTIMDENTDNSTKMQVVISLRYTNISGAAGLHYSIF